ncbi:MAG TPA: LysR family transcriptional regulator [Aliidongia sp.]|uniref:LysR family transcriptional regulator n=1 Tax=Aliidongia sp. TaxID=1914230 RepID=UPI002DDCE395|nr:LysR family transcriptional regulator [Aliidongia sp.]HEV2673939.1 LysR family transcriptional regulator [Aliidongia sp.]
MPTLSNIDVGLLRTFVAVAETGRMTAAAKIVNVSQGAVSQQIKRLEGFFEARFFDRTADAVRLTRAGERLIVHAHQLIALNDAIMGQMRAVEFAGEVRLGVPHDIVGMLMPPILRSFRQAHPNVLVTLVSDTTRSLRTSLRDRLVDLALLTELEPGDGDQLLMSDRLVWVGARGGDAGSRRPVPVALGQESCGFRASTIQALTKAGLEWRAICQVGSLEPVFATLEADMAVATFLSRTVPDRLATVDDAQLPPLPRYHVNLRLPSTGVAAVTAELARHVREGFARRYP